MTPQERAQDIKAMFVAAFAFLTALFGWLGIAIIMLVAAMLVDYLTGSMAAKAAGEWSSEIARAGLRHKLGTIIAVGVAAFADAGVQVALNNVNGLPFMVDFTWPQCFTLLVVLWYFFTELGSILENAGKLGAPIPPWMKKGIAVLKNKTEEKIEEGGIPVDHIEPAAEVLEAAVHGKHEMPQAAAQGTAHEDQKEDLQQAQEQDPGPSVQEIISELKDID
ncbi:MAG: phage holin family protein [Oscillospiraceae bacterium]|nr:phage holin family protein [Oscillospiraceae bacterium]